MKLILFDFDGVLANTHSMCYEIHKENNPTLKYKFFQSLSDGNFLELWKKAENDNKINQNPKFHSLYIEGLAKLGLSNELKEVVLKLSQKYSLYIISSTSSDKIRSFLERAQIADAFKIILGSDVHTNKTKKITELLKNEKISPTDVIFVTDTTGDIMEARVCGIMSIAVSWGLHDKKYLLKQKPFALVDTPQELEQKIKEFFASK